MAHENPLGPITLPVAAATEQYRRVKFDGSQKLVLAGATDKELGTTEQKTFEADEPVAVRPRHFPGSRKFVAAGAIAVGAKAYTAAGGKVSAAQATGAFEEGTALTAAAADLDILTLFVEPGDVPKP